MHLHRVVQWLVASICVLLTATALVAVTGSPAAAKEFPLGGTTIKKVVMQPAKKRIRIAYENHYHLPAGARVGVQLYPALSTRGGTYDRLVLSGSKGKHVAYLKTGSLIQVLRVRFLLNRQSPVDVFVLARPKKRTTSRVVSRGDVLANEVMALLPGAAVTLIPHARLASVASRAILGWSFADVVNRTLRGSGGPCPRLARGQYIRTTSSFKRSGSAVTQTIRFRVWPRKKRFDNGKRPACNVVTSHRFF